LPWGIRRPHIAHFFIHFLTSLCYNTQPVLWIAARFLPMPDRFMVRRAEPLDAAGYIALIKAILGETPRVDTPYAPDEFDPSVERIRDRILEVHESDNSLFLVADADRKIVGALTCGGGTLAADHHMTVLGVYVAKTWRDQGIGNMLMAQAVEWAKASPVVERVELEVYARNARAIHLYEKHGFEHEGRKRRLYYQDGEPMDMLIMALLLEKNHDG
jgi:ribosomal protein S18 acetylase RimI-like enzyme